MAKKVVNKRKSRVVRARRKPTPKKLPLKARRPFGLPALVGVILGLAIIGYFIAHAFAASSGSIVIGKWIPNGGSWKQGDPGGSPDTAYVVKGKYTPVISKAVTWGAQVPPTIYTAATSTSQLRSWRFDHLEAYYPTNCSGHLGTESSTNPSYDVRVCTGMAVYVRFYYRPNVVSPPPVSPPPVSPPPVSPQPVGPPPPVSPPPVSPPPVSPQPVGPPPPVNPQPVGPQPPSEEPPSSCEFDGTCPDTSTPDPWLPPTDTTADTLPELGEVSVEDLEGASDSQIQQIIEDNSTSNDGSEVSVVTPRVYGGRLRILPPSQVNDDGADEVRYYINGKLKKRIKKAPFAFILDTTRLKNNRYILSIAGYSGGQQVDQKSYLLTVKNRLNFWQIIYNFITWPFSG